MKHHEETSSEVWKLAIRRTETPPPAIAKAKPAAPHGASAAHAATATAPAATTTAPATAAAPLPVEDAATATPTMTAEVLACPGCQRPNHAARNFCVHCGSPLLEPCLQCGTICTAGERFCGVCGSNLESSFHRRRVQFEANFREAEELQDESRFDEASDILKSIAAIEHPRLADVVRRANEQCDELSARRERSAVMAEEIFQKAAESLAARNEQGAIELLKSIPEPLRTPPMDELLTKAQIVRDEVETLAQRVHEALAAGKLRELNGMVERFFELKADHPLVTKLQEHLCAAARTALARHRYDEALSLLEQVPVALRSATVAKYHAHAAELACLFWDLRNSPVIDATLLAVADRLCKAAPKDKRLPPMVEQLRKRAARPAKLPGGTRAWAAPPEHPPLGFPVDWLTTLASLPSQNEADAALLAAEPGQFLVAGGLALQGLERSVVETNLLPSTSRNMLGRLTSIVRRRSARSAWGIDVGTSGLKALKLVWDEAGHAPRLAAVRFVPHQKSLSQLANDDQQEEVLGNTLRQLLAAGDLKADRLCVSVSARWVVRRQFKLPAVDPAKQLQAVEFEARTLIPVSLGELVWDYQAMDEIRPPGSEPATGKAVPKSSRRDQEVVLMAVRRSHVERLLRSFQALKLAVDVVQTDAVALYNMLFYECFATAASPLRPAAIGSVAVLDVGLDATNFVACGPHVLWFRNFGVGGQTFTRALVQEFQLTGAQGEQLKREPSKTPRLSRLERAVAPVHEELLREIRTSLELLTKNHPEHVPTRLLVVGGGMRLHGLFRYLRTGK